ncbi:MAG TPA: class 1 fructose-bisphosphatase [Candidatus Acidoferrales bacterium]|nr:class 1 fructose-bisphosphatase [Candidatus Acidoferrales bacterium]
MSPVPMTLSRHILEEGARNPAVAGELSTLIAQLGFTGKALAREMRRAALVGELGLVGERNATGDAQKKLDVYSNEVVVDAFEATGLVAAIASEELEEIKHIQTGAQGKYILCTDPLDGSSNTDINGALGTIFGFYRRVKSGGNVSPDEVLRPGTELALAGYILYSTSTMFVYTAGNGVHGFTLDADLGEFLLSHKDMRCPKKGKTFSANIGHVREWPQGVQDYVTHVTQMDKASNRPYSLRYSGALVGDVHRILLEGGIYFYPPDPSHKEGKLRLVYECAPLGFVAEQAGGAATSLGARVTEMRPSAVHHRCPFAIGGAEDVALFDRFVTGKGAPA